jgi:AhpD family alkylhydroperoxidase
MVPASVSLKPKTKKPMERREAIRQSVQQKFGFVPQLFEELLRTNPAVAEAYLQAGAALQQGVLSPLEQQVVQLTVATYNACHYCTGAHGSAALRMGLSPEAVDAILEGRLPEDERLALLVETTREVLERRGWLAEDALQKLEARGLDRAVLYEIIALIGVKTITNYINHLAHTPVDEVFRPVTERTAYRRLVESATV